MVPRAESGLRDEAEGAHLAGRPLAIEDIVAAALRVGTSKGFDALTMRALAEELGVSVMAAYHHVRNKNELIYLVIDSVLARVEIPQPGFGDWSARLRELQHRATEALQAWPGLDVLVYSRPPTTNGWRLMDGYLRILLDGGFTPRNAVLAFSVMHSYGMGRTMAERHLLEESAGKKRSAQRRHWPALREVDSLWSGLRRPDFHGVADEVILSGLRAMRAAQDAGDSATADLS